MPNTKTGITWAPDIRPESIETFTETYTPEGGEKQTVTYKRVADHPILNGIRDKLAFFMTHAGAVWYNKQAGRTVADEIRDLNAKMSVTQSELISSVSYVNILLCRAYKVGRIITFYMECKATVDITGTTNLFTLKSPYRPQNDYIVIPIRDNTIGYPEIATMWVNLSGTCVSYGSIAKDAKIYIQGSFAY